MAAETISIYIIDNRARARANGDRLHRPHCNRSVRHIYMSGGANACRHCLRLTYESRRSRSYDRLAETVHKLRVKLGGDPGFDSLIARRPKGMHRKTYDRMVDHIHAMESASRDRAALWLGRIEARSPGDRRELRPDPAPAAVGDGVAP